MKRLLFLLLIVPFLAQGQAQLPTYFASPNSPTGYYALGWIKTDSGTQYRPRANNYKPLTGYTGIRFSGDTMYYYSIGGSAWVPVSSSSGATYTAAAPITLTGHVFGADTGRGRQQLVTGYDLNKVRDSLTLDAVLGNGNTTNKHIIFNGAVDNAFLNLKQSDNAVGILHAETSDWPLASMDIFHASSGGGGDQLGITQTFTAYNGVITTKITPRYIAQYNISDPTASSELGDGTIYVNRGSTTTEYGFSALTPYSDYAISPTGILSLNTTGTDTRVGTSYNPTLTALSIAMIDTTNSKIYHSSISDINYWIKKSGTTNKFYLPSGDSAAVGTSNVNDAFTVVGGTTITNGYISLTPGFGIKTNNVNSYIQPVLNRPNRWIMVNVGVVAQYWDSGRVAFGGTYSMSPGDTLTRVLTNKGTSDFRDTVIITGRLNNTPTMAYTANNQVLYGALFQPNFTNVGGYTSTDGIPLLVSKNTSTTHNAIPEIGRTVIQGIGADGFRAALLMQGYGSYGMVVLGAAGGTEAAPTSLANSSIFGQITAQPYGSTAFASTTIPMIRMISTQNTSDTGQGAKTDFSVRTNNTTGNLVAFNINQNGNVSVGKVVGTSNFSVIQAQQGIGKIDAVAGSAVINGHNTMFLNTFRPGQIINGFGSGTKTISSITDDSTLTLTTSVGVVTATNSVYNLTATTPLSVLGNGNVGIGTTTPSATTNTQKALVVSDLSLNAVVRLEGASSGVSEFRQVGVVGSIGTAAAGDFNIYANGTTRIGINNSTGALTFSGYSTNGGLLYTNGSGVVSQTGAGTSTTILHGGTSPAYSAVSLTADITGTLPIANGGTNITSYTTGDLLYASSSTVISKLAIGSTGNVLTVSGGIPSWSASFSGTTVTGTGVITGLHFTGNSGTPTTSSLGANVTSATISGNDAHMKLTVVTSGVVSGTICNISFATAYATTPAVVFSTADNTTGTATTGAGMNATSGSSVTFAGTITGAGTYVYNIIAGN